MKANTKFKKGVSGNPRGRKPGQTAATIYRKVISEKMPELLDTLIGQALGGDTHAAKILIDRIVPQLRPASMPANIKAGDSLVDKGAAVVNHTLGGAVPVETGRL